MAHKIKHNRIKPKPYKNKAYLNYMHNSDKVCIVCGSPNIELHHIKTKTQTAREDNKIVPLCPEHHRGKYAPHGFDSTEFYDDYSKEFMLELANDYFAEYESL